MDMEARMAREMPILDVKKLDEKQLSSLVRLCQKCTEAGRPDGREKGKCSQETVLMNFEEAKEFMENLLV